MDELAKFRREQAQKWKKQSNAQSLEEEQRQKEIEERKARKEAMKPKQKIPTKDQIQDFVSKKRGDWNVEHEVKEKEMERRKKKLEEKQRAAEEREAEWRRRDAERHQERYENEPIRPIEEIVKEHMEVLEANVSHLQQRVRRWPVVLCLLIEVIVFAMEAHFRQGMCCKLSLIVAAIGLVAVWKNSVGLMKTHGLLMMALISGHVLSHLNPLSIWTDVCDPLIPSFVVNNRGLEEVKKALVHPLAETVVHYEMLLLWLMILLVPPIQFNIFLFKRQEAEDLTYHKEEVVKIQKSRDPEESRIVCLFAFAALIVGSGSMMVLNGDKRLASWEAIQNLTCTEDRHPSYVWTSNYDHPLLILATALDILGFSVVLLLPAVRWLFARVQKTVNYAVLFWIVASLILTQAVGMSPQEILAPLVDLGVPEMYVSVGVSLLFAPSVQWGLCIAAGYVLPRLWLDRHLRSK